MPWNGNRESVHLWPRLAIRWLHSGHSGSQGGCLWCQGASNCLGKHLLLNIKGLKCLNFARKTPATSAVMPQMYRMHKLIFLSSLLSVSYLSSLLRNYSVVSSKWLKAKLLKHVHDSNLAGFRSCLSPLLFRVQCFQHSHGKPMANHRNHKAESTMMMIRVIG